MNTEPDVATRLREARDLGAILPAAYNAFEVMLSVLRQHQDRAGGIFAAFVMSAASAADGRDAVAAAPSMPRLARQAEDSTRWPDPDAGPAELADGLADLSQLLGTRLAQSGRFAVQEGDQRACAEAVQAAEKISALLRGTGQ